MPRLHALCRNTTAASVRINSIVAMARLVGSMDNDELLKMCATVAQVRLGGSKLALGRRSALIALHGTFCMH